jgi:hypothetical protein
MTHIALSGSRDGKNVDWMEEVTDEQYGKALASPNAQARDERSVAASGERRFREEEMTDDHF